MSRLIDAFEQFFDSAGNPLVSGQLDFFESGSTSVRKKTFSSNGETTANTNPVIINGDGRAPNIFGTGNYRVVLRFAPIPPATVGVQILVRDPVGGNQSLSFGADWEDEQPYNESDVVRDGGLYWISLINNNLGNNPTLDDGTNWDIAFNKNTFAGDDPTLASENAALIIGTDDPLTDPHIAIGPTTIQAKTDFETASLLELNPLGGQVNVGAGNGIIDVKAGTSLSMSGDLVNVNGAGFDKPVFIGFGVNQATAVIAYNLKIATALDAAEPHSTVLQPTSPIGGGIEIKNTKTGGGFERALTESDKFSRPATPVTGATATLAPGDVGKDTEYSFAGTITLTIADSTINGIDVGDVIEFWPSDAIGEIDFAVSGSQSIIGGLPATTPTLKTASVKYLGSNNWKYIEP